MNIIAHRGFWRKPEEKNSIAALTAAFALGFGVETDIRDYKGGVVISHDPAEEKSIPLEQLFSVYLKSKSTAFIALNVKADGIQSIVEPLLHAYNILNYAFFDSSVPELYIYKKRKLNYFSRLSDIEEQEVLADGSCGVWIDSFLTDRWLNKGIIESILLSNRIAVIVSPELHQRDPMPVWELLKGSGLQQNQKLYLCTDLPLKAKGFFNE